MDRRRHEVRRTFAGDLDDVFAEIGFGHFDARGLQGGIEVDFLAGHRLRFDGSLAAGLVGDFDDDLAGILGGIGRPMDVAAEPLDRRFELLEIAIEMGEACAP